MDAYSYIAQTRPREAVELCRNYGYQVAGKNVSNVATALKQLVARHGEPALLDMAEIHPDRDLLREGHTGAAHTEMPVMRSQNYEIRRGEYPTERYHNAIGAEATTFFLQNNTFLMVTAMIVAVAIVVNGNKK